MEKLEELYDEIEVIFNDARKNWELTRPPEGGGRRANYWQGKKDGLRIAMNLLCSLIKEEKASVD